LLNLIFDVEGKDRPLDSDLAILQQLADEEGLRDVSFKDLFAARRFYRKQTAICWASSRGRTPLVKLFLSDSRCDPSANDQVAICFACRNNHPEVVALLLADPRVVPPDQLLVDACRSNFVEVVKRLLAHGRVDPSYRDQSPLRIALSHNNLELLKLLLAAKRVTNSTFFRSAIGDAIRYRFIPGAELLLADRDFDPSGDEQFAIRIAPELGLTSIVSLLLADDRVDPSVANQTPVRNALHPKSPLLPRLDVVISLLSDRRVMVPLEEQTTDRPILTALMLLRRQFRQDLSQDSLRARPFRSLLAKVKSIEAKRFAQLETHLISVCLDYVPDLFCHRIPKGNGHPSSFCLDLSEAKRYITFASLSIL
jgi:ankyrin repeat protein